MGPSLKEAQRSKVSNKDLEYIISFFFGRHESGSWMLDSGYLDFHLLCASNELSRLRAYYTTSFSTSPRVVRLIVSAPRFASVGLHQFA